MKSGHSVACGLACVLAVLVLTLLQGTPLEAQGVRGAPTPARTTRSTATPTTTLTTPVTAAGTATPAFLLPTPTPPAFVLLPAPSVKNQLAGDVVTAPGLLLSGAYQGIFGDRIALAMTNLRDTSAGSLAGDGIKRVTFTIIDTATGEPVHTRVAGDDRCAFGAAYTGCVILDLAATAYTWPEGAPVHSGHYLLVAFAEGVVADHKGTWTLPFELRLARDGLQALDAAARIRAMAPRGGDEGSGYIVTVETFGFAPLAAGTHLHLYGAASAQAGGSGPTGPVVEFPADIADMGVGDWRGSVRVDIPIAALDANTRVVCVAVAHPDHTILRDRGECVALGY